MIKAKNIFKHYKDLRVLNGVNIDVKKSEVISIVGASGAGKTTLLQILGSLEKADQKDETSIIVNGTDLTQLKEKNSPNSEMKTSDLFFSFINFYRNFQR